MDTNDGRGEMRRVDWDFVPEAVVVGNGEFPVSALPLRILDTAPFTVCCDGAADRCLESGRVPDRIVGDGDSLSVENQKRYAGIIRYNPDQETNDQTKAVSYLLEKGFRRIAIVGATGRREDHTLGNISLLMEYMRMGAEVRMYTDYGFFVPVKGDCRFFCCKGVQVSIFAFGTRGLRGEGLAYPLRDFANWWQGTLNEATGEEFVIRGEGEYLVFINMPTVS